MSLCEFRISDTTSQYSPVGSVYALKTVYILVQQYSYVLFVSVLWYRTIMQPQLIIIYLILSYLIILAFLWNRYDVPQP